MFQRTKAGVMLMIVFSAPSVSWAEADANALFQQRIMPIFLDSKHVLADDPAAFLSSDDDQGAIETSGVWAEGFKDAKTVSATELSLSERDPSP